MIADGNIAALYTKIKALKPCNVCFCGFISMNIEEGTGVILNMK